jgi:hypothetical protein
LGPFELVAELEHIAIKQEPFRQAADKLVTIQTAELAKLAAHSSSLEEQIRIVLVETLQLVVETF